MNDLFSALAAKRQSIIRRKNDLTAKYETDMAALQEEADAITAAIVVIEDAIKPFVCPRCGGSGSVRVCDAAGDMDDDVCPICRGTGIKLG